METMENIGSCQLGNITDKKFLKGIIPSEWSEVVYEHNKFWACKCKRHDSSTSSNWCEHDKEFNKICKNIESEFKEHLMEIYSITSVGVHFIVYLRKKIN